jgi:penicillin-binding protein 1A
MSENANKKKNKKKVTKYKSKSRQSLNPKKLKVTIRNPIWSVIRFFCLVLIWGIVIISVVLAYEATQLPNISKLENQERSFGVRLLASNGEEFASFGDLYRKPALFEDLPSTLVNALVATEDRRFHSHFGIDPISIIRAALINLRDGSIRQGGSTITQQLAKNLFLTSKRNLERKIQELLLAFWLEASFSKNQILTLYLNRVYFGSGSYGIQSASHHYFNKPVEFLELYDTALLVGLLKAPSRYNPIANPVLADKRTTQVLINMVNAGFLDKDLAKQASKKRSNIAKANIRSSGHRYFADWVRARSSAYAAYLSKDQKVYTTFRSDLQNKAEAAISKGLQLGKKKGVLQAAMVVLDKKGAVLAMVGGKSYSASQFNRATQAHRQPGSAFKPIIYLAALNRGYKPATLIADSPLTIGAWSPQNFDGKYRKTVSLREALTLSLNVASVRLSENIGRSSTISLARKLGITSKIEDKPSLALGTSEVTLLELTAAYVAFSNGGYPIEPYGIKKVVTANDDVIYKTHQNRLTPVAKSETIKSIDEMLVDVIRRGTGKKASFSRVAAGKTGTSQSYKDAWFIGYSGPFIVGIWLGRDDAAPMDGVTGGGLPAKIWSNFMRMSLKRS